MKGQKICSHDNCTGCGACATACKIDCIKMETDSLGSLYPKIDVEKCVECNACKNVCPMCNDTDFRVNFVFPQKTYAAWSQNKRNRENGASGGIATELYLSALKHQYFVMGTFFDREKGVTFREVKFEKDIEWARDSKYVYSDMRPCFKQYREKLNNNKKCLFIGLPCQAAALKNYVQSLPEEKRNLLITVDLICHGVPNFAYLDQHLTSIEKKTREKIHKIFFRHPIYIYFFRCVNHNGKNIYIKQMHGDDLYYKAFSLNLNFRQSCYHCKYARSERITDITIGDYSGLGSLYEFPYDKKHVSVVFSLNRRGEKFLKAANIELIERPCDEPLSAEGNPNLRHPSIPYKTRSLFVKEYIKTGSYEYAARKALKKELFQYHILFPVRVLQKLLSVMLPKPIKEKGKSYYGKRK